MSLETLESRHLLTTFTVNTQFDIVDADDELLSLREAIALADDETANPGHDTIVFDEALRFATVMPDIVGFDQDGQPLFDTVGPEPGPLDPDPPRVPVIKGQFEVSSAVTIDASGVDLVRIGHDRGFSQSHRILRVNPGATVELVNVVVQGGDAFFGTVEQADGGGIYNEGVLTLRNVVVGGNVTTSFVGGGDLYVDDPDPDPLGGSNKKFRGGGIFNSASGELTLINSHIGEVELDETFLAGIGVDSELFITTEEREYDQLRAAAVSLDSALRVNEAGITRISGNVSWGDGGGIYNLGQLSLTEGSVVAGNRITGDGGGIYNAGFTRISDSTIRDHELLVAQNSLQYVASLAGGGIFNATGAELVIEGSELLRNVALTGGAIHNEGQLDVEGVLFADNRAQSYAAPADALAPRGGSIYDEGSRTRITRSSLTGSSSRTDGGGIYFDGNPDARLNTVTVSGNDAREDGGGIYVASSSNVAVASSTIARNQLLGGVGGGVFVAAGGSVEFADSIVADNTIADGARGDLEVAVGGSFASQGQSVFETSSGVAGSDFAASDIRGVDAGLGPLGFNGGETLTHGLLPSSPALDSIVEAATPTPLHEYDLTNSLDDLRGGSALTPVGELRADGNGDGVVNAADYTVWRDQLGLSGIDLPGDYDRDGQVTEADYEVWRDSFGKSSIGRLTEGGYRFAAGEGLQLSGLALPADYSIEVTFSWDTLPATQQRKILDFAGQQNDGGVYTVGDRLWFEGESLSGPDRLEVDSLSRLVVTRDSTTELFTAYLDGEEQWSFTDLTGLTDLSAPTSVLTLFLDDTVTNGSEAGAGLVTSLKVYESVLDGTSVRALEASITDQRGEPRIVGSSRDRGAFESQPLTAMRVDTLDGVADGFYEPGFVSLADAVQWANAVPGADTIAFAPELVEMLQSLGTQQTIDLAEQLTVTEDLTIFGPGAELVSISGRNSHRVFDISAGVKLDLRGLTLSDGNAGGDVGGAIRSFGKLLLEEVVVRNSTAVNGGGVYQSGGELQVVRSTIHDNIASSRGAGIEAQGAQVDINNSTISSNTSNFLGGGGVHLQGGSLDLRSTTITANRVDSPTFLTQQSGAGVQLQGDVQFTTQASLLAGNFHRRSGVDEPNDLTINAFPASVVSLGHNLFNEVVEAAGVLVTDVTDQFGVADPLVGVLSDLGGPTPTHGLLPGSPALDRVPNAAAPSTDQRGVARPIGSLSDIGAFEAEPPDATNPLIVDTLSGESDGFFGPGGLSLDEAVLIVNAQAGSTLDEIRFDPALFNLARVAGVTTTVSTSAVDSSAEAALDGDPATSWNAAIGDTLSLGGEPFFEVTLPEKDTVTGLRLTDTSIVSGRVGLYCGGGTLLHAADFENLDPSGDLELSLRGETGLGVADVVRVRVFSRDTGNVAPPRIAEFELVGVEKEIALPARTLQLAKDVTIVGPGADRLRISGGDQLRVFEISPLVTASISGLTIAGGDDQATGVGGGVLNQGDLTLSEVHVTENRGGIRNSTGAVLAVARSTIAGNASADGAGGVDNSGNASILNSTVSGNSGVVGGGLFNNGFMSVEFSTVVENLAESGGGIANSASGVGLQLRGTIVATNPGEDIENFGVATSLGHNLIGNAELTGLTATTGDLFGSAASPLDPQLTDLILVGGPTPVHALLPGSPAEEAGDPVTFPATDQRGVTRPQVNQPDIGAFESEPVIVGAGLLVDSLSDVLNGDYSSGNLTLREAVLLANLPDGRDVLGPQTIRFSDELIAAAVEASGATITLAEGPLVFRDDIIVMPFDSSSGVEATRRDLFTIDADGASRVVEISSVAEVQLHNLTLTGGATDGDGGGVLNRGDLLLHDVTVADNSAASGGGVANERLATVAVDRSLITTNVATAASGTGGGLLNRGDATLTRSAVSHNIARRGAGVHSTGSVSVDVSTVSSNGDLDGVVPTIAGGGVYVESGFASVNDSTIAANEAADRAGGLLNTGQLRLFGSIVASNIVGPFGVNADASLSDGSLGATVGVVAASGFNLVGDNSLGFVPTTNGNLYTPDAMLGPLADNGGVTPTHALLLESPALDSADPTSTRLFDQRGLPLTDVPGGGAAIADIGAYERQRIVRSEWRYEALGQSQFGPGEANIIGFGFDDGRQESSVDPDPHFVGFEFDTGPLTYGGISNGPFGSKFGGELEADFAGRFGFDIGYYVNSGSVDVTYDGAVNYVVDTDPSGASADISAFVEIGGGSLYTVSPKVGAYADIVLDLDAQVSATACLFGCVGGDLLNLQFAETVDLLSLNRQVEDEAGRPVFLTEQSQAVARDTQTGKFYNFDGQPIADPGPVTPLLDGDIRLFGIAIEDLGLGRISNEEGRALLDRARGRQNAAGQLDDAQKSLTNATNDRDRLEGQLADAERRLANPASNADAAAAQAEAARIAGADYAAAVAGGAAPADRPAKEGQIGAADDARASAAQSRAAAESKLSRGSNTPSNLRTPGFGPVFDLSTVDGNLLGVEIGVGVGASAGVVGAVSRDIGSLSISLPDVNLRDTLVGSDGRLTASTDAFPDGSVLDANRQIAKAQVDLTTLLPLGPIPTGRYNASLGPISLDVTTVSYDVGPELNVTQDVQANPIIVDQGISYSFFDPVDPIDGALSFSVDVNGVPVAGGAAVHTVTFSPGDKVTVHGGGVPVLVQPALTVDARLSNDIGLEVDLEGVFEAFALQLSAFGATIVDIGPLIEHTHTLFSDDLGSVFDKTFDLGQSAIQLAPFTLFDDDFVRDGRTAATALLGAPTADPDTTLFDQSISAGQPLWVAAELFDPANPDQLSTQLDIRFLSGSTNIPSITPADEGVTVTPSPSDPTRFTLSGYDASLLAERSTALVALTFGSPGQAEFEVTRSTSMDLGDVPDVTANIGGIFQSDFDRVGVSALITTDIDGDGLGLPDTDGELLLRYLNGVTGSNLVDGAIGEGATRTTAEEVTAYIEDSLQQTLQLRDPATGQVTSRDTLDFDGSGGAPDATVDGELFRRYLSGLRGTELTDGLATATTGEEIVAFIEYGRSSANDVRAGEFDQAADRVGGDVFGLDGALDADNQDGASGAGAVGPGVSASVLGASAEFALLSSKTASATAQLDYELSTYGQPIPYEEIFLDGQLISRVAEGSPTNFGSEALADLILNGVDPARVTSQSGVGVLGVDEPLFVRAPDAAGYEYRAESGFAFREIAIDPQVGGNLLLPGEFDLYLFDTLSNEWVFEDLISEANPTQVGPNGFLVYEFAASGVEAFRLFSHSLPNVELHDADNAAAPVFESIVGFELSPPLGGTTGAPIISLTPLGDRGLYVDAAPLTPARPVFSTDSSAIQNEFVLTRSGANVLRSANGVPFDVLSMSSTPVIEVAGSDLAEDTLTVSGAGGPIRTPISFSGGFRTDTIRFDSTDGAGLTLDLVAVDTITEVEVVDLRGSGANALVVNREAVEQNDPFTHTLRVRGDADDRVQADAGWAFDATESIGLVTYNRFVQGGAVLFVEATTQVEFASTSFNSASQVTLPADSNFDAPIDARATAFAELALPTPIIGGDGKGSTVSRAYRPGIRSNADALAERVTAARVIQAEPPRAAMPRANRLLEQIRKAKESDGREENPEATLISLSDEVDAAFGDIDFDG